MFMVPCIVSYINIRPMRYNYMQFI
jgi:hypothetical protein